MEASEASVLVERAWEVCVSSVRERLGLVGVDGDRREGVYDGILYIMAGGSRAIVVQ